MEAFGEALSRERQIDTAIKQRLYMSPAGTPREVRASTEGHDVFVQQMASWALGGTELIPRFTVPLAIARLSYRVQGTKGRWDLRLTDVNGPANPGYIRQDVKVPRSTDAYRMLAEST